MAFHEQRHLGPVARGTRELTAEEQLGILRWLSTDLAQANGLEAVLKTIARSTMSMLGYEDCVIYLVGRRASDSVLVQRAAHGPKSPDGETIIDPIVLDIGQGIVGTCAASAVAVRVMDTSNDSRYVVDDAVRGSELAVPIIDNGEVIGVIDSEHSETGFYSSDDEQALTDIAGLAAARLRTAMTIESLEDNVKKLELARQELDLASRTDVLTGLLNRRGFEDALQAFKPGQEAAAALADVDRFKALNDNSGHSSGDYVLRKLGRLFASFGADRDLTVARLGGDEFALLGDDMALMKRHMVELIQQVRSQDWNHAGVLLEVTISAGLAAGDTKQVWTHADEALYLAKANGRDQLIIYDSTDPRVEQLEVDKRWADEVRLSIATTSPLLYAQPIVWADDPTSPPAYHEVLLRRREPDGTAGSPGRMLAAAERFGLSERLDTWVVQSALRWLGSRGRSANSLSRLAVNVSAPFVGSPRAVRNLAAMIERSEVQAEQLCFEITESMAIENLERTSAFVHEVRQWGAKVAIDDFGSGWTTLPLVQDLGVDVLKIDGSWITKATTDELARSVVGSTVEAAQIIGVDVVAEWVEDQATLTFVRDLGIEFVQGFLTGGPAPLSDLNSSIVDSTQSHQKTP